MIEENVDHIHFIYFKYLAVPSLFPINTKAKLVEQQINAYKLTRNVDPLHMIFILRSMRRQSYGIHLRILFLKIIGVIGG